jgi:hypothetical protein
MIEINMWAIIVCAVISMIIGMIWYGPLFGRKWAQIIGADLDDMEARKRMQKEAGPMYALQFLLSLFQVYVLAYYIAEWKEISGVVNALWIWAGFVVPIIAGTAMWNNDPKKVIWARFLIQAGYQLVCFVLFGLVLSMWR